MSLVWLSITIPVSMHAEQPAPTKARKTAKAPDADEPEKPQPKKQIRREICPEPKITHNARIPLSGGMVHSMTDLARQCGSASQALQEVMSCNLVILDFYSDGCGPCREFAKIFADVAREYPKVVFVKINVAEHRQLQSQFGVRGVPAIFFIKNGTQVLADKGKKSAAQMRSMIKGAFGV